MLEELSIDVLSEAGGLEKLITFMDSVLLKDQLSDAFDKYDDFEKYNRTNETISEYIEEFDLKYKKLTKFGITLPQEILAFKLLIHADITSDEQMIVKSGINYTEKDKMYDQTKASLRKFKGECGGSAVSNNCSYSMKLESVNANSYKNGFRHGKSRGSFYKQNYGQNRKVAYGTFDRNVSGNSGRQSNPVDAQGNVMRCLACESIRHLIRECPHSYENSGSVNSNGDEQEEAFPFDGEM